MGENILGLSELLFSVAFSGESSQECCGMLPSGSAIALG